ncbi:MAG TPA: LptE family protein [Acidobacteriaceae bacterium]|nr:LptE family protein [Acidobacteriaceae bacterium]
MPRAFRLLSASAVLLLATGCGYHTLGSATHIPADVHTIAVPFFDNRTQFSHTEVALTQATVHELNTRTKFRVLPREDAGDADAVLKGTVLSESIVPYTYSVTTGQSSSYMITLTASVSLTDRDGRVLYRHDGYTFHQQYEATSDLGTFVQEDSPAMTRLSRDFAQSLVSDMLESF